MTSEVLYETGFFYFPYSTVLSVLLVLYGIYWVRRLKREGRFKTFTRGFMVFWLCFAILFLLVVQCFEIAEYYTVVVGYNRGKYLEIDGVVSGLEVNQKGTRESFAIDDVKFEYFVHSWKGISYSGRAGHGGAITEDGQYVRIRYVQYRSYNRIVYIEQLRG